MESKRLNKLSEEQLHFFESEGYLMVGDIFNPIDLDR